MPLPVVRFPAGASSGTGNHLSHVGGNHCAVEFTSVENEKGYNMSELLPCPFCGNDEILLDRMGTSRQSCIVRCGWCGCVVESNENGFGAAWNTRSPKTEESATESTNKPQGGICQKEKCKNWGEVCDQCILNPQFHNWCKLSPVR